MLRLLHLLARWPSPVTPLGQNKVAVKAKDLKGFGRFLGFNPLPPPNPPKPPYPPGVTPPNPPGLPPPDPPGLWGWGAFLILGVKFFLQVLFFFWAWGSGGS